MPKSGAFCPACSGCELGEKNSWGEEWWRCVTCQHSANGPTFPKRGEKRKVAPDVNDDEGDVVVASSVEPKPGAYAKMERITPPAPSRSSDMQNIKNLQEELGALCERFQRIKERSTRIDNNVWEVLLQQDVVVEKLSHIEEMLLRKVRSTRIPATSA